MVKGCKKNIKIQMNNYIIIIITCTARIYIIIIIGVLLSYKKIKETTRVGKVVKTTELG